MENLTIIQSVGLKTAMLEAEDLPLVTHLPPMPQGGVIAKPKLPKYNNVYMVIVLTVIGGCVIAYIVDSMQQYKRKELEKQQQAQY